jgi:hypothetical protein
MDGGETAMNQTLCGSVTQAFTDALRQSITIRA